MSVGGRSYAFASLELARGFGLPRDVEASFDFLVNTLTRGLSRD